MFPKQRKASHSQYVGRQVKKYVESLIKGRHNKVARYEHEGDYAKQD